MQKFVQIDIACVLAGGILMIIDEDLFGGQFAVGVFVLIVGLVFTALRFVTLAAVNEAIALQKRRRR